MTAIAGAENDLGRSAEDSGEGDLGGGTPRLPTPVQPKSEGERRKPRVVLWAVLALILGGLAGAAAGYVARSPEVGDLEDQLAALQEQQATLEADAESAQNNEQAMAEQVAACENAIDTGWLIMDNRMRLSDLLWDGTDSMTETEFAEAYLESELEFEGLIAMYDNDALNCVEGPGA